MADTTKWLSPALDYIPRWMEFQMRASEQPGCVIAISHKDRIVLEEAFGYADLAKRTPLTPRHRFRIASHSKTFTTAGVMKLRERRKLKLDDEVGEYVPGLNAAIARTTLTQILSHSAGLVRDGKDSGQFSDRRPFFDADEVMADLAEPPVVDPNTQFKYSNHGFALIGLVIEAVTGEPFTSWIKREVIDAAGLRETYPDQPIPKSVPMASGHSGRIALGGRVVIPGGYSTRAVAPAGGVVSTARDTAMFFSKLSPKARSSLLSVASRREMVRRQWKNQNSSVERYYGLGTVSGTLNGWDWFGHTGGLQGYITRTSVIPEHDLTISVLTNAIDGWASLWSDGVMHILCAFCQRGAPSQKVRDWAGRWWSLWGAADLLPAGNKVLLIAPGLINPFGDAAELEITGRDSGRITLADGYSNPGEPVRRIRSGSGRVVELWLGASRMVPEEKLATEMKSRYGAPVAGATQRMKRAPTRAPRSRR